MGLEAVCTVRLNGKATEAKALLETSEIIVRGEPRLRIPFKDISGLSVREGTLNVTFSGGVARFELGKNAEKWAVKIKNPRGLLDMLDVKPDSRVAVVNVTDKDFLVQLSERVPKLADSKPGAELNVLFYGVEEKQGWQSSHRCRKPSRRTGPSGSSRQRARARQSRKARSGPARWQRAWST